MKKVVALGVVIWIAFGIFNYGAMCAQEHWESDHDYCILSQSMREDAAFATLYGVMGPVWTIPSVEATAFLEHGWKPWFGQYENECYKSTKAKP